MVGGAVDLEHRDAAGRRAAVERAVAAGDGRDRDDVVELAGHARREAAAVGHAGGEDAVGAGQRERLGEQRAQVVEVGRAHLVVEAPELVRGGARVEHGEAVVVGGVGEAGPAREAVPGPARAVEGEHEPDGRLGRDVQERVAEPVGTRRRRRSQWPPPPSAAGRSGRRRPARRRSRRRARRSPVTGGRRDIGGERPAPAEGERDEGNRGRDGHLRQLSRHAHPHGGRAAAARWPPARRRPRRSTAPGARGPGTSTPG